MSKKKKARGAPDQTSLAFLLEEFHDVLGMELYPEAIDELPTERGAWPVDLTIRTGPPRGMTTLRKTPKDPTIRTGPPSLVRKKKKEVLAPPPAPDSPQMLPLPRGFKGLPQDLIQTKVARRQAPRPPAEPVEPARAFLPEVPTDRFVPLRRSADSVVNPPPVERSGGLDLEYFRALDAGPVSATPTPPHPLVTHVGPHSWRATLLSLFLGVSVGLALALVASAVLLLLVRS